MTIASILMSLAEVDCVTKKDADILEDVIKQAVEYDKKRQARIDKLQALEAAGVDSWEGYDIAMRELYGEDEEDDN